MFKASFVCYRSDKYLNANEALNANAMFQPSSNLNAWEFNTDSTSEVKELIEICAMYNEIPSKNKSFGIIISNVFLSVSDVAKNSQALLSGELTFFDLVMKGTSSKDKKQPELFNNKEQIRSIIGVSLLREKAEHESKL